MGHLRPQPSAPREGRALRFLSQQRRVGVYYLLLYVLDPEWGSPAPTPPRPNQTPPAQQQIRVHPRRDPVAVCTQTPQTPTPATQLNADNPPGQHQHPPRSQPSNTPSTTTPTPRPPRSMNSSQPHTSRHQGGPVGSSRSAGSVSTSTTDVTNARPARALAVEITCSPAYAVRSAGPDPSPCLQLRASAPRPGHCRLCTGGGRRQAAIYPLKAAAPAVSLSVVYLPAVLLVSVYSGTVARLGHVARQCCRVQLLSPAARGSLHDFRQPELGRPGRLHAHRRRSQRRGGGGAQPHGRAERRRPGGRPRRRARARTAPPAGSFSPPSATPPVASRRHWTFPPRPLSSAPPRPPTVGPHCRCCAPTVSRSPRCSCRVASPGRRSSVCEIRSSPRSPRSSRLPCTAMPPRRRRSRPRPCDAVTSSRRPCCRAVSHDLRTPLTAIVTAGHALGSGSLTPDERGQLSGAVVEEGERLSALIDKLLDLSRPARPRRASTRLDLARGGHSRGAGFAAGVGGDRACRLIDPDVPPLLADASWSGCSRTCSRTPCAT